MTEIDYGRLDALEAALGGRAAIRAAYETGIPLVGGDIPLLQKGAANGVGTLDGTRRQPLSETALAVVSGASSGGIAAWAPATAYPVNRLVTNSGQTYICLVAHTSGGSFSGVGTNWALIWGSSVVTSAPNTFTAAQTIAMTGAGVPLTAQLRPTAGTLEPSLLAGTGKGYGPPPSAPTPTAGAAGALTGVYQYAYTETGPDSGETTLSPAASVTLAGQKANITLPLPRRGTGGRILYRTKAGGSTFFQVSAAFNNNADGGDFVSTLFVDNVADAALTATQPPVSDGSHQWTLQVIDDLPVFAISPAANGAADLALLTADPGDGNTWAMDSYGTLLARSKNSFKAVTSGGPVGSDGSALECVYVDLTVPSDTATLRTAPTVFRIAPQGHIQMTQAADVTSISVTQLAGATGHLFAAKLVGDTQSRMALDANGTTTALSFGPGNGALDAILQRPGAFTLGPIAGTFWDTTIVKPFGGSGSTAAISTRVPGDTADRLRIRADGKIFWGDGAGALDSSIDRTGVNALRITGGATVTLTTTLQGNVFLSEAVSITVGTASGTKIGTATNQKLGFYNTSPVVQPSGTPAASTDLASVIALANSLRTNLLALGLVA